MAAMWKAGKFCSRISSRFTGYRVQERLNSKCIQSSKSLFYSTGSFNAINGSIYAQNGTKRRSALFTMKYERSLSRFSRVPAGERSLSSFNRRDFDKIKSRTSNFIDEDFDSEDLSDDENFNSGTKKVIGKTPSIKKSDRKTRQYSHDMQKTGSGQVRSSRYVFKDLQEGDNEELLWIKRDANPVSARRRVEWYANQMLRLANHNQVEKAQDMLQSMRDEGIQPSTEVVNILISAYARAGKTRKAFHHYNNIKKMGLKPTPHTYTSLFNACTDSASLEHTQKLWDELHRRINTEDLNPHVITYNAAIKAFATCGSPAHAFNVYEDMRTNEVEPDCYTSAALLSACASMGSQGPSKALSVLEEMKENGVQADIFVFNLVLKVIRDARTAVFKSKVSNSRDRDAEVVEERDTKSGIVEQTASNGRVSKSRDRDAEVVEEWDTKSGIVEQTASNGRVSKSRDKYAEVVEEWDTQSGIVEQTASNGKVFKSRDRKYAEGVQGQDMMSVSLEQPAFNSKVSNTRNKTNTGVAEVQGTKSDSVEQLENLGNTNGIKDRVNLAYEEGENTAQGLFSGVENFLQLMAVNDVTPDIRTFHLLLQVSDEGTEQEKLVLCLMEDCGVIPDAAVLNTLVKSRARDGDVSMAKEYIKMFQSKYGLPASENTYECLASGCRNYEDGSWLLQEMKQLGITPKPIVYMKLISSAARKEDYTYLNQLMKKIKEDNVQPLGGIIELLDKISSQKTRQKYKDGTLNPRAKRSMQFVKKQQTGFHGFYNTWKQGLKNKATDDKGEASNTPNGKGESPNIPNDKGMDQQEELNYDHL